MLTVMLTLTWVERSGPLAPAPSRLSERLQVKHGNVSTSASSCRNTGCVDAHLLELLPAAPEQEQNQVRNSQNHQQVKRQKPAAAGFLPWNFLVILAELHLQTADRNILIGFFVSDCCSDDLRCWVSVLRILWPAKSPTSMKCITAEAAAAGSWSAGW